MSTKTKKRKPAKRSASRVTTTGSSRSKKGTTKKTSSKKMAPKLRAKTSKILGKAERAIAKIAERVTHVLD